MLSGLALLKRKVLPYHADRNTPSPNPKRTKKKHFSVLDMFNRHQYLTYHYVEYCGYDEGISWSKPIFLGIIEQAKKNQCRRILKKMLFNFRFPYKIKCISIHTLDQVTKKSISSAF